MALAFLLYTLGVLALAKAFSLVYVATKTKATRAVGSGAKEAQQTEKVPWYKSDIIQTPQPFEGIPPNPRQVHEGTSDLREPAVLREFERTPSYKGSAWPPPL